MVKRLRENGKIKRFYSGGIDCCYCYYFGVGGGYGAECVEIC